MEQLIKFLKNMDWNPKPFNNILFTGTNPKRFAHLGHIIHQPMVALKPLTCYKEVDFEIEHINKYDWIIFTSQYAVTFFCDRLINKKNISTLNICAIGKTTASYIVQYGLHVSCTPDDESTEGIIKLFKDKKILNKKILIPRSNFSNNKLPDVLCDQGAKVKAITVYENTKPVYDKLVPLDTIDEIFFTSPSTIKNFLFYYKTIPDNIIIRCIGNVTYEEFKKHEISTNSIKTIT